MSEEGEGRRLVPVGGGGGRKQELEGKYCVHMYVNAKMITVEAIPGMEGGRDKGE
jgi:hypothetical protein